MAVQNSPEQIQAAQALMNAFAAKRPGQYAQMMNSSTENPMIGALATTYQLASIDAKTSQKLGMPSKVFPSEVKAPEPKIDRPEQNRTNIPLLKG